MTDETTAEQLAEEMKPLSTEETKPMETQTATATKKPPVRKVSAKATAAPKRKAAPKKAAAKKTDDENQVTLKSLAKEHKLTASAARRKLRASGLKTDGRWSWAKGSSDLKKADAALAAAKE